MSQGEDVLVEVSMRLRRVLRCCIGIAILVSLLAPIDLIFFETDLGDLLEINTEEAAFLDIAAWRRRMVQLQPGSFGGQASSSTNLSLAAKGSVVQMAAALCTPCCKTQG